MTMATLTKENISLELTSSFRGLVHYHHGGKHGSMQTYMVLGKEMRGLSTFGSAGSRRLDAALGVA